MSERTGLFCRTPGPVPPLQPHPGSIERPPGVDSAASLMAGWGQWRFAAQLGGFVGVQPIDILAVGARVQLVVEGQPEVGDGLVPIAAYVSAMPFVRLDTRPVFAEVRLLMNLDEYYGVAFDRGATWSLTAMIGTELF